MLFLRPLSILGVRLPQLISWVYDPMDLVKDKQKEYLQTIQRCLYVPPQIYTKPKN